MTERTAMVAGYLVSEVPRAMPEDSAGAVRASLAGRRFDAVEAVYVVDVAGRYLGAVPLTALLAASETQAMNSLMITNSHAVAPDLDREDAASIAIREGLPALPVVADGRLIGAVPAPALMAILRSEHLEDIHHMAGILHASESAREALESSPLARLRYRLPWLLLGTVGAMFATFVVAGFERSLEANVHIAFFIPAIVYLADAIGTQSEAVAVRGLSLSKVSIWRLLGGEVGTGLLIGMVLAVVALIAVYAGFADVRLALAVSIAIFFAGAVATTLGLLLPWTFARFGTDPALASGPLGTILQDVLSLVIYFAVVTWLGVNA
jgi:magnesium transporter